MGMRPPRFVWVEHHVTVLLVVFKKGAFIQEVDGQISAGAYLGLEYLKRMDLLMPVARDVQVPFGPRSIMASQKPKQNEEMKFLES